MPTLVLLRHGQSQWNLENRFTGWWDVDLRRRASRRPAPPGGCCSDNGFDFDCCFTSVLTRAIRTLHLALHEMDRLWLPVTKDWRLNERHYGGLTGLNKPEMVDKVGAEQVKIWRRSFDVPPPPLPDDSPYDVQQRPPLCRHRRAANREPQGHDRPRACLITRPKSRPRSRPASECSSLRMAISLRGIIKYLSNISDDEIVGLEIPTGQADRL